MIYYVFLSSISATQRTKIIKLYIHVQNYWPVYAISSMHVILQLTVLTHFKNPVGAPVFPPFNSRNVLFTCLCSFFTCFAFMPELSLVPRPFFYGGGKNGLVYTVGACALFPWESVHVCTLPLYLNVIFRYIAAY